MSNLLIIAAEASSVLYAEQLMRHWGERGRNHHYWGVGSRTMAKKGFDCLGFAEDMAVMGFSEVLKHYSDIKGVFQKIVQRLDQQKPDVAVLIDYPGFNLKLSEELRKRNIPVVYYISPQVWAWKKNRIHTIKANVDKMLVVFPFEKEFYKNHQVNAEYVGHPLLDDLKPEHMDPKLLERRRGGLGIKKDQVVLGLMPGSRNQEIERHLEIQLKVAETLLKKHPKMKVLLLVAPTLSKEVIQDQLESIRFPITVIQDEPYNMIGLTDGILAASGTATLMVGLLEKPMVIMYKMSWFSAFVSRRIIKNYFGLVNLLSGRIISPELFQERATPKVLTPLVEKILFDPSVRAQQIEDLQGLKKLLGGNGVTARVATAIEEYLPPSDKDRN